MIAQFVLALAVAAAPNSYGAYVDESDLTTTTTTTTTTVPCTSDVVTSTQAVTVETPYKAASATTHVAPYKGDSAAPAPTDVPSYNGDDAAPAPTDETPYNGDDAAPAPADETPCTNAKPVVETEVPTYHKAAPVPSYVDTQEPTASPAPTASENPVTTYDDILPSGSQGFSVAALVAAAFLAL